MNAPSFRSADDQISAQAAAWTIRRDRGLTPRETEELDRWLAADLRHAPALGEASGSWGLLARMPASLAKSIELEQIRTTSIWPRWVGGLAAAAVLAFGAFMWSPWGNRSADTTTANVVESPRVMHLSDGTNVQLNTASEVVVKFSAAERSVVLVRGEASFVVAKDPARPFIVRAGLTQIRAVGTIFNVNLATEQVEVVVSEGKVSIVPHAPDHSVARTELPLLVAGQRAVVSEPLAGGSPTVVVSEIAGDEMVRALAWQKTLMNLGGATLEELAGQFLRRTNHRLIFADAELARIRVGGRFPEDDVTGFVRFLEANCGVIVERRDANETVLRRRK